MHLHALSLIPCKDVSPKGDEFDSVMQKLYNTTRWSTFLGFLDRWGEANDCNGDNAEAERILQCIKKFSAAEWKGCLYDEKFECGCGNDHGINYCCGSADQAEAIEIWSQCLAGE